MEFRDVRLRPLEAKACQITAENIDELGRLTEGIVLKDGDLALLLLPDELIPSRIGCWVLARTGASGKVHYVGAPPDLISKVFEFVGEDEPVAWAPIG